MVKAVLNLRAAYNTGNFLISWEPIFSRRTLFNEVNYTGRGIAQGNEECRSWWLPDGHRHGSGTRSRKLGWKRIYVYLRQLSTVLTTAKCKIISHIICWKHFCFVTVCCSFAINRAVLWTALAGCLRITVHRKPTVWRYFIGLCSQRILGRWGRVFSVRACFAVLLQRARCLLPTDSLLPYCLLMLQYRRLVNLRLHLLTTWSRVLLEKLTGSQLV